MVFILKNTKRKKIIFIVRYHYVIECNSNIQGTCIRRVNIYGKYVIEYHSIVELVLLKIKTI